MASFAERRKTVAEDIFLRMVVGWEGFISEWFIGAVNHDAIAGSDYVRYSSAFRAPVLTVGKNPAVASVRELLDPGEGNIEFRSLEELLRKSADLLVRRFVERVGRVQGAGGDEIIGVSLSRDPKRSRSSEPEGGASDERAHRRIPELPDVAEAVDVEGRHKHLPRSEDGRR